MWLLPFQLSPPLATLAMRTPTPVVPETLLDPFDRPADFLAVLNALTATLGRLLSELASFDDLRNKLRVTVEIAEAVADAVQLPAVAAVLSDVPSAQPSASLAPAQSYPTLLLMTQDFHGIEEWLASERLLAPLWLSTPSTQPTFKGATFIVPTVPVVPLV